MDSHGLLGYDFVGIWVWKRKAEELLLEHSDMRLSQPLKTTVIWEMSKWSRSRSLDYDGNQQTSPIGVSGSCATISTVLPKAIDWCREQCIQHIPVTHLTRRHSGMPDYRQSFGLGLFLGGPVGSSDYRMLVDFLSSSSCYLNSHVKQMTISTVSDQWAL